MVVAVIAVLLSSVLFSSVLLPLTFFSHVLLLSSITLTFELEGPHTTPNLIRVLPPDPTPSGCVESVDYTLWSSEPSSLSSTSLPCSSPSATTPTPDISSPFLNPQTMEATIMSVTPPLFSTSLPHDPIHFASPHNGFQGSQVSSTRGGDGHTAQNNKLLFRPHLLLVALSPHVPGPSRLPPCSEHYKDLPVLRSSLQEGNNFSGALGEAENKISGNDFDVQAEQSQGSPPESNQASIVGKAKLEQVNSNLNCTKSSKKLLPDDGSDASKISQTALIKENSPDGHGTKGMTRHLRPSAESASQGVVYRERKTRRAHGTTARKIQVNYSSLRAEQNSAATPHYERQRIERQNRYPSTLRGAKKIKSPGDPIKRRITHPTLLPFPSQNEGVMLTDPPEDYERRTPPKRGFARSSMRIHIGRNIKTLLLQADARGASNTVSGRREQALSSLHNRKDIVKQLDEEKYGTSQQQGESFENPSKGRAMEGGEEKLSEGVEDKSGRHHENSDDTSFHTLHMSPFIPDLTLSDDDSPANPSHDQPSLSLSGIALFPTHSDDDPSASDDTRTPTTQSFTTSARLRGIKVDLDKRDKSKRSRERQIEDPSMMTYRAGIEVETTRGMNQPLPVRPGKEGERSDNFHIVQNEPVPHFYEPHTDMASATQDLGQLSLLLPSPDEGRAGKGRKVQQGPAGKRRGTSQEPDVPLLDTEGSVRIPCYVIIFLLGVIGNTLVIVTLLQNRKMRTITNVFLLNLAFSDLLLGVFCMPFTLIGSLLRDFIFGAVMCRLIPYFQAVSVSVSVWTLVAISLERFYAICQPLKSRGWQTLSHAYKIISLVWLLSLVFMAPIAVLSQLLPVGNTSRHKCREMWPSLHFERGFSMFLCAALLLVPLVIMVAAYSSITVSLWHGMRLERETGQGTEPLISLTDLNGLAMVQQSLRRKQSRRHVSKISIRFRKIPAQTKQCAQCGLPEGDGSLDHALSPGQGHSQACLHERDCENFKWRVDSVLENSNGARRKEALQNTTIGIPSLLSPCRRRQPKPDFKRLRSTHLEKSIEAKKHVIRMLFVVVLEFFLCWTPIFVVNIMCLYIPEQVYRTLGSVGISFLHLLSYASSCCNPITYCFMNKKFLQGFRYAFGCRKEAERSGRKNGTAASFRSQSNNIFKLATEVKRDARETTV